MSNTFKSCKKCNDHLSVEVMIRTRYKTGKYFKKTYNCTGRSRDEFSQSMEKVCGKEELR